MISNAPMRARSVPSSTATIAPAVTATSRLTPYTPITGAYPRKLESSWL